MYMEILKLFTLLKLSTEAFFVEMIFIIAKKKKCMYF